MGRPATGKGTPVMVRIQPEQLALIDDWAAAQVDKPSRPEAMRRLAAWGLTVTMLPDHKGHA